MVDLTLPADCYFVVALRYVVLKVWHSVRKQGREI